MFKKWTLDLIKMRLRKIRSYFEEYESISNKNWLYKAAIKKYKTFS
jgi:hypothetical protein